MAPLWRSVGVEPDGHAGAFRGLYIDLSPPSFAWEEPLGDSIRLGHAPAKLDKSPAWLDTLGRPLVYVTLGTVFNKPELLRQLLDGLDGSVSALVTTGRNVDPESLGGRPSNVRVERFVPQEHVLPRALPSSRMPGPAAFAARSHTACHSSSSRRGQISSTTLRAAPLWAPRSWCGRTS